MMILALLLTACGFQLRGSYGIDESLQPMQVSAGGDFGAALRVALETGGVSLTDDAAEAAAVLRVTGTERDRRVLAIDERGRVDEYELEYRVAWHLERGDGSDETQRLIKSTGYSARRSYIYDAGSQLAADDEEEVLIDTLYRDLADRILRRIETWSPEQVDSGG